MTKNTIASTVAEIMTMVLQMPVEPGRNLSRESESRWDSLKHVETVFALEDAFDLRFTEGEIAGMTSQSAIVSMIEAKRAS